MPTLQQVKPPPVLGYSSFEREPFAEYIKRWPPALSNFPPNVVEFWVHRHWSDFQDHWLSLDLAALRFEFKRYTNPQVMQIGYFEDRFEALDHWGDALFVNPIRKNSWLGKYMLENGTVPEPPILAIDAHGIVHPRGLKDELMQVPSHLIEGHMRLAYLRGMIRNKYPGLKPDHPIWEMRFS